MVRGTTKIKHLKFRKSKPIGLELRYYNVDSGTVLDIQVIVQHLSFTEDNSSKYDSTSLNLVVIPRIKVPRSLF